MVIAQGNGSYVMIKFICKISHPTSKQPKLSSRSRHSLRCQTSGSSHSNYSNILNIWGHQNVLKPVFMSDVILDKLSERQVCYSTGILYLTYDKTFLSAWMSSSERCCENAKCCGYTECEIKIKGVVFLIFLTGGRERGVFLC